ncbi:hypothetical protein [Massilia sp. erpn]|uniref:hypothetical protein n=1 Tax=Massilia sp. erpn TaxID=2738142 RepID=UPI002101FD59|nr:hypothetical protein [Massilia sp. erpn]UTY59789.1 hypothetical protein HPQ68_22970 [Massilia sp. erpn]
MASRLIDYYPELELSGPENGASWRAEDAEIGFGARLLAARSGSEIAATLAELARMVGGGALVQPLSQALYPAAAAVFPLRASDAKLKAARLFGLELEGLSPEDKEFELALHFTRFAFDTVRNALAAPGDDAAARVRSGLMQSARRHAPGLLRHGSR